MGRICHTPSCHWLGYVPFEFALQFTSGAQTVHYLGLFCQLREGNADFHVLCLVWDRLCGPKIATKSFSVFDARGQFLDAFPSARKLYGARLYAKMAFVDLCCKLSGKPFKKLAVLFYQDRYLFISFLPSISEIFWGKEVIWPALPTTLAGLGTGLQTEPRQCSLYARISFIKKYFWINNGIFSGCKHLALTREHIAMERFLCQLTQLAQ